MSYDFSSIKVLPKSKSSILVMTSVSWHIFYMFDILSGNSKY